MMMMAGGVVADGATGKGRCGETCFFNVHASTWQ